MPDRGVFCPAHLRQMPLTAVFLFQVPQMQIYGIFRNAKAFCCLDDSIFHIENTFFVQEMDDLLIFIGSGDHRIGVYFCFGLI